ncbi:MAG: iron-sulfur cluster assembly accessory protein [Acetobacteraceae bacterium]|nr:iron-sulfur cluster assembly accessory protein [Acetobacteraceae bacterium]
MSETAALPGVTLTEGAIARIREILAGQPSGRFVRLAVNAGGCSGFSYAFDLDDRHEADDRRFGTGDAGLVIDPASLELLAGSVVDFEETLGGSAFKVKNPNATSGCGCGSSFST